MERKNGLVIFEVDKDENGNEIGNSSQRNNELVWPTTAEKPNAQYRTSWKNMCNVTSYVMALEYAGWQFPTGTFRQPEDNLGKFILTDKSVRDYWQKTNKAGYDLFMKSLDGKCTKAELENMYFPTELHNILSYGANKWMGQDIAKYSEPVDLKKVLWENMVDNDLPVVLSTKFGGYGHIVCCTGVAFDEKEFDNLKYVDKGTLTPKHIIVDDPWGKYNPSTNLYDAPNGGNDIIVPWNRVELSVRNRAHTFKHPIKLI